MAHVLERTEDVLATDLTQVVAQLVDILGARAVALIGGVNHTRLVRDWMDGTRRPKSEDREHRLRLALRVARSLDARFGASTVRAWFWGANRQLDDEMPIAVLAKRPLDECKQIIVAAEAFAQI